MYFVSAPLLSPLGIAMLADEWLEDNEDAQEQVREEAYLKAPTVSEYFKRAGWRYYELVEAYAGQTAKDIEDRFEEFLRLKNLPAHERVAFCSNPEILTSINENSYAEIKRRKDHRLMEWALFHKHREDIKKAYGVVSVTNRPARPPASVEDKELYETLLIVGFIILLMTLAGFAVGLLR